MPRRTSRDERVHADGYEVVRLDELNPYPGNAKRHDIDAIRESLRTFGFVGALLVQTSTRRILAGNGTWQACHEEGFDEVPIVWRDCSDVEARGIVLAWNRLPERGYFDNEALAALLQDQSDAGALPGTGYVDDDLAALLADHGSGGTPGVGGVDPDDVNGDDRYEEQYGCIVICRDEEHQADVYAALHGQGYDVRVVTT